MLVASARAASKSELTRFSLSHPSWPRPCLRTSCFTCLKRGSLEPELSTIVLEPRISTSGVTGFAPARELMTSWEMHLPDRLPCGLPLPNGGRKPESATGHKHERESPYLSAIRTSSADQCAATPTTKLPSRTLSQQSRTRETFRRDTPFQKARMPTRSHIFFMVEQSTRGQHHLVSWWVGGYAGVLSLFHAAKMISEDSVGLFAV